MLLRALLRRCPNCGSRGIFAGYVALKERCPSCGLRLHRGEHDYFIGAYLLNLVAVELLFAGLLAAIFVATYPETPWALLQWGGLVLMLAGAVLAMTVALVIGLVVGNLLDPSADLKPGTPPSGAAQGTLEIAKAMQANR